MSNQDLDKAALKGALKPLKEAKTLPQVKEEKVEVIDDPTEFQMAISKAQMEGVDSLEVTERIFNWLIKNNKTASLTYGNPGVRVFKTGTKDSILNEEKMNAEDWHAVNIRRQRQANGLS